MPLGSCTICDEMVYEDDGENVGTVDEPEYVHFDC